jgi:hypothetical protein
MNKNHKLNAEHDYELLLYFSLRKIEFEKMEYQITPSVGSWHSGRM